MEPASLGNTVDVDTVVPPKLPDNTGVGDMVVPSKLPDNTVDVDTVVPSKSSKLPDKRVVDTAAHANQGGVDNAKETSVSVILQNKEKIILQNKEKTPLAGKSQRVLLGLTLKELKEKCLKLCLPQWGTKARLCLLYTSPSPRDS